MGLMSGVSPDGALTKKGRTAYGRRRSEMGPSPNRSRVEDEIKGLTTKDLILLNSAARRWVNWLGPCADGRTADDLLQAAFLAALTRAWPPELRLVPFLIGDRGLMRSIVSNWLKYTKRRGGGLLPGSNIGPAGGDERNELDPVLLKPSREEETHRQVACRETLADLIRFLGSDQEVMDLVEAFRLGYTGPEIQELLGITQTEFETRMTRMRRKSRGLYPASGDRYE